MDKIKVGKFIALLRKEKNITQDELAEKVFVARNTISKWERGVYIPTPDMLLTLSNMFDVTINEILAGERLTEKNKKEIDSIPLEIIKEKEKIKKVAYVIGIVLLISIISFLTYYFINNYNSISVYTISGENDNVYIQDGIMTLSREKAYIRTGNIFSEDEKQIESIKLYYLKNGKEKQLYNSYGTDETLVNIFGNDELFSYNDIKYIKSDLYLEINIGDKKEKIKLDVVKDFSNKTLFYKNNKIKQKNNNSKIKNSIPKYIIENYQFNKDEQTYYKEDKLDSKIILQKYMINLESFIVTEEIEDKTYQWEYSFQDHSLSYFKMNNNKMLDNFTYSFEDEYCTYGECIDEQIKYFKSEYLEKIR